MQAVVHMQPLDERRNPIGKPMFAGMTPRDGVTRQLSIAVDLDPYGCRMPFYLRVWADGKHGGDFEIDVAPPERLRKLNGVTCAMWLAVNPKGRQ